jgi:hypothetical protein
MMANRSTEGVMSGIIDSKPFAAYFPETKNNSTYQGFVTAIYEIGEWWMQWVRELPADS